MLTLGGEDSFFFGVPPQLGWSRPTVPTSRLACRYRYWSK